jgi:hypothetical protein
VLWRRQWERPQAIMWEANGQHEEVALYCRALRDAERPKASVGMRTLVRQLQETLGLSLPGLHRNHWVIEHDPLPRPAEQPRPIVKSDARDRLKVVRSA